MSRISPTLFVAIGIILHADNFQEKSRFLPITRQKSGVSSRLSFKKV
jgi:hypothetical protein